MIRPRIGSFLYSEAEIEVMKEDIRIFKEEGADGVVFGVLTTYGQINVETTRQLVNEALPLQVCFHRAFDMTQDPHAALQHLYSIPGITRVLTSGHGKVATSPSSLSVLSDLHEETTQHFYSLTRIQPHSRANSSTSISSSTSLPAHMTPIEPITILPGSGINPNTVQILLVILLRVGLKEVHLSAGRFVESEMQYRKRVGREDTDAIGMGMGEWKVWKTDEHAVRQMRGILDRAAAASPPNSAGLIGLPSQRE
ncbi:hypothetical protein BDM02DRAFT_3117000 [Thelephora ganbajun]|uniref:Uncharacterized protein n=1 Tax=Thelephora ganbajun TaxID=370292 RepID=A0ACB6ZD41_THEGA|nr:hypothetical protein BDM02DRAFT_3117000 [Thelephora ganbajun]